MTVVAGSLLYVIHDRTLCTFPLSYSIGEFDNRFSLTRGEARLAMSDIVTAWEEAVQESLFVYKEADGDVVVNFIFDDRQEFSDEEQAVRTELRELEAKNSAFLEDFSVREQTLQNQREEFRQRADRYREALARYNQSVAEFNAARSFDESKFTELQQEQSTLEAEATALDRESDRLNAEAQQLQRLAAEGNESVRLYNELVTVYNATFGQRREFTQGDYQERVINIYTFRDGIELRQVLAHEFGHALKLEHVSDPAAIMHAFIGGQPTELTIMPEDIAEFERVCRIDSRPLTVLQQIVNSLTFSLRAV